jgi:hypothetical protein
MGSMKDGRVEFLHTGSELGLQNSNDVENHLPVFALQRLNTPGEMQRFDTSSVGIGNDHEENSEDHDDDDEQVDINEGHAPPAGAPGVRVVRQLSLAYFRGRLVEYFDILFKRHELV